MGNHWWTYSGTVSCGEMYILKRVLDWKGER